MPNPQRERRTIHFRGRVQGVGFRYTTQRIAQRFDVAGTVRNLANGDVRLVIEGEPSQIDRVLSALRERFTGHIDDETTTHGAATGEFPAFDIVT